MKKNSLNKGRIFLIPTVIAEKTQQSVLPHEVFQTCSSLDFYLAENVRSARRFISSLKLGVSIENIQIEKFPDTRDLGPIHRVLKIVESGRDLGVVSEAGCPAIADPGAVVVAEAHKLSLEVIPLVGPSSILLALMASGLNGQSFRFHGYLPIQKEPLLKSLKSLERDVIHTGTTQIFMETPYRNEGLLNSILQVCETGTLLCIAKDLTGENMYVRTQPIHKWAESHPELHKQPVIFLIGRDDY